VKIFSPRTMLISLTLLLPITASATPRVIPSAPIVAAKAYILIDHQSGKVLAANNEDKKLHPASLTKMMTSYVIGQELKQGNISLEDNVEISENAWAKNFPDSSKMFIEVGTKVKLEKLNRGIIIQSGNDACVAVAEHIAGTEQGFAQLMNDWATQLGMNSSHFVNSHGLSVDNHYTTARDMATLSQALIRDVPNEYAIYSEKSFKYNNITQYNRNALLWDASLNVDGIKTGHTSDAGYSLVSSATKNGMRLIAVVMGTKSDEARKSESKKLLNWGFRFFETVEPYPVGHAFVSQQVWMGTTDKVSLGINETNSITIPRGLAPSLKASYELDKELEAPIQKGDVVGKVSYLLEDEVVAEFPLVTLNDVDEGGWFSKLIDYFKRMFMSWFS